MSADNGQVDADERNEIAPSLAWRYIASERMADCRVFQVRKDRRASPRDGREHDFYCIEAPDWINIIPLTLREEVVMIEQWRHGVEEVTLEIPGGMVDAGESAHEAAARELLEETGYAARGVELLGKTRPNPAIQNNWLHSFIARGVEYRGDPVFDSTEQTRVRLVPFAEIPKLIRDGAITHSLVVACFHLFALSKH